MAYLTEEELKKMNFKKLGKNVKISDRAAIYTADQISIGDNSRIDDFCVVSGKIDIGRNVHLPPHCLIHGSINGVVLEDFVTVAYGGKIIASTDDYTDGYLTNSTIPAKYKKVTEKSVLVKSHAIIGTNAVVLPGVTIGYASSIGAGAVVTKDTEDFGIYVGIPAKYVKKRGNKFAELEAEYLRSEDNN